VLYAGTRGQGIFKSADGGATWNTINNGIGPFFDGTLNVYGIWIDPRRPSVLYATTYPRTKCSCQRNDRQMNGSSRL